jgi:hypothetical protein
MHAAPTRARSPLAGLPGHHSSRVLTPFCSGSDYCCCQRPRRPTTLGLLFPLGHPPQAVSDCTNSCACMQLLHELGSLSPACRASRLKALDARLQLQRLQLLPATKAPPPPPPSTFPWDIRRKLAVNLACLNAEHCYGLIEVLHSCHSAGASPGEELVMDLDALPVPVLAKLTVRSRFLSIIVVMGHSPQAGREPRVSQRGALLRPDRGVAFVSFHGRLSR